MPHRETRTGRLGQPPIIKNAKNGGPQERFASERVKKVDTGELGAAHLLRGAFHFVEYAALLRIGKNFVRKVEGIKRLGITCRGVVRSIFLGERGVRPLNRCRV